MSLRNGIWTGLTEVGKFFGKEKKLHVKDGEKLWEILFKIHVVYHDVSNSSRLLIGEINCKAG